MDRGAWRATVHGVARVRHGLVAKPPPPFNVITMKLCQSTELSYVCISLKKLFDQIFFLIVVLQEWRARKIKLILHFTCLDDR